MERLVFFTDAVVAIAMALLILPLMEIQVRRTPAIWNSDDPPVNRISESVALSMTILFALAALVAVLLPPVNLMAMYLLLTGPVHSLIHKRMKPLSGSA